VEREREREGLIAVICDSEDIEGQNKTLTWKGKETIGICYCFLLGKEKRRALQGHT
jgi:hypothetical protein